MIARILLYIKHHLPFIWSGVEWLNALLFKILHFKRLIGISNQIIAKYTLSGFSFRKLEKIDLIELERFLKSQPPKRVAFFKPHRCDIESVKKVYKNPSFLMLGVFNDSQMVGYFFLRCFWNKKCFVGRLVDKNYEGKGIGKVMSEIMYNIAWSSGFRCLSTISKNNHLVMRSHAKNINMKKLKELANNYLLVEFVKSE